MARDETGAARPTIVIDPAIQFGQPCLAGRRVPAEAVAGCVWAGDAVDAVAEDYDLTRADVLIACWYVAKEGTFRTRRHRVRAEEWRDWAADNHRTLASWDGVDPATAPDPPASRG